MLSESRSTNRSEAVLEGVPRNTKTLPQLGWREFEFAVWFVRSHSCRMNSSLLSCRTVLGEPAYTASTLLEPSMYIQMLSYSDVTLECQCFLDKSQFLVLRTAKRSCLQTDTEGMPGLTLAIPLSAVPMCARNPSPD